MSIEAMKQALEALEELHRTGDTQVFDMCYAPKVIPALRQAIEQAEKQRPVAFNAGVPPLYPEMKDGETISVEYTTLPAAPVQEPVALETVYETIIQWDEGGGKRSRRELARRIMALYTTPQPAAQNNAFEELAKAVREFAIEQRAIEAKLKEKNT